jgi:hypothetical protein
VSPIQIDTVTVPVIDAPQTTNEPTIESVVQEELSNSSDDVKDKTDNKTDSTKEVKENKQDGNDEQSENSKDDVVDSPKEIVHGFGLVLSLELLNKPIEFYQPPLTDMFSITQEFPINATTREFQLDLLKNYSIENYYNFISNRSWERIRRSDLLQ